MKVLIGCEFSGIVREAFKAKGHDAWSCDLLPTEIPGNHIQCDILHVLDARWDLGIFHPDCKLLANSGVRWLWYDYEHQIMDGARHDDMCKDCMFFNKLLNAPINKICIENPIQHKHAREYIRKYDQIIQPWQFGHGETKATCLWLKNLPKLKPTNVVDGREGRVWKETPCPDRWKNRSRFYKGFAEAMANQWG